MVEKQETVWRNGHGFRGDAEQSARMGRPYIACFKCGTRADGSGAARPCVGHYVKMMGYGGTICFDIVVEPKGRRKSFEQSLELDVDGLGAYLDFIRQFTKDNRGHADWHWKNADREFPCSTCDGPMGDEARRLEASQREAIDAEVAPPKLGAGATA